MVTLTADVTKGVKEMAHKLVEKGIYKSQSEVVRDAIRQLAYKYNVDTAINLKEVRKITTKATKKSNKNLSKLTRELRDEV